jgi:hypothetical protein
MKPVHQRVVLQKVCDCLSQSATADPMDNANAGNPLYRRAIQILFHRRQ